MTARGGEYPAMKSVTVIESGVFKWKAQLLGSVISAAPRTSKWQNPDTRQLPPLLADRVTWLADRKRGAGADQWAGAMTPAPDAHSDLLHFPFSQLPALLRMILEAYWAGVSVGFVC